MVKIFLKHFIYETCIDVIFNHIAFNFFLPQQDKEKWLTEYTKRMTDSDDFIVEIDRRIENGMTVISKGINPYVRRALQELKKIKIRNGTWFTKKAKVRQIV